MMYISVTGPVALSTPAKLIAPGAVVNGTMSITKSELYFEMDEEDPENKKIHNEVRIHLFYYIADCNAGCIYQCHVHYGVHVYVE